MGTALQLIIEGVFGQLHADSAHFGHSKDRLEHFIPPTVHGLWKFGEISWNGLRRIDVSVTFRTVLSYLHTPIRQK